VMCCVHEVHSQPMETSILENTIIKLGTLLALGFGEAGTDVISRCMQGDGVNVMTDGHEVQCVIGKADISDFDVITQVLQQGVMTFVNQVAEIVHGVVNEYGGAANRSDGASFLLIWNLGNLPEHEVTKIADMAMVCFAHIYHAVHSSRILASYRKHPGLQYRISNFRVNVSLGLHSGWAIEGAVGTEFKIDASYLSPNVNIAESTLVATRLYGVSVMATGDVMQLCSQPVAEKCRLIDRLMVKGSRVALDVFCIDLSNRFIGVEGPRASWIPNFNSRQRYKCRQVLEAGKTLKWMDDVHMVQYFSGSLAVNTTRMPFTREFMEIFKMGYRNYVEGEWHTAKRILLNTQQMLGFQDGPSAALLRYMGAKPFYFVAPVNWAGVHTLESMIDVFNGRPAFTPQDKHRKTIHRARDVEEEPLNPPSPDAAAGASPLRSVADQINMECAEATISSEAQPDLRSRM